MLPELSLRHGRQLILFRRRRRARRHLFYILRTREMSAAEALQQEIKQQGETVKALKAEKKVRLLSCIKHYSVLQSPLGLKDSGR